MSPHYGSTSAKRESRVKVGGAFLALILLENGRQVRARLSQVSANGGLLALDGPLDEGIKVTVVFHIGETSIRSSAEMLFPMWATKGYLQPFRFRDLGDQERSALLQELQKLVGSGVGKPAAEEIVVEAVQDLSASEGDATSEIPCWETPQIVNPDPGPAPTTQNSAEACVPQIESGSSEQSPAQQLTD